MQKELKDLLAAFISFETTEQKPEMKRECRDWLTQAFLGDVLPELTRGESAAGDPYFYYQNPEAQMLLFAHFDVVPGSPEQFALRESSGKLYGRGVKDMKGAALSFLLAFRDARNNGEKPRVSILLTSDEEVAGKTIPELLDAGVLCEPVAFTPDTGAEPWMVTEHKGVIWADLVIEGRGGHASEPWKCENPMHTLALALSTIQEAFPMGTSTDWKMTVTPTTLSTTSVRNQIPEKIHCGLDIRYTAETAKTQEEVLSLITKVLPQNCSLQVARSASPHYTDPAHPAVILVKRLAEEATGTVIEIGREHGGTDARYFGERGIPAFLYGPEGGDLHGKNEWVSLTSLEQHYQLYRALFRELESGSVQF